MKKILVVDDEQAILTLLVYNLEQAGYLVETEDHGGRAYDKIMDPANQYDFIILDVMLPGMDGMDICRKVRQEKVETPILMLTARDDEYDKIIGLELGADDYLTKPFSPREVIARIKAIMRRTEVTQAETPQEQEEILKQATDAELTALEEGQDPELVAQNNKDHTIQLGRLTIFSERYEVQVDGKPVDITPKEFELLIFMAMRRGRILSREQLLNNIWDYDYAGETRIVDVHISHLREKLERDTKNPQYIKTIRGFGYKFEVPEADEA